MESTEYGKFKYNILYKYQENYPVPISKLVAELESENDLKIKLFLVSNWKSDISGKIEKSEKDDKASDYAIYLNQNHSKERQRFTIAHEIAHFILHKDKIGYGITDTALYSSNLSNTIETEANKLAADILMPYHLIEKAIHDGISYNHVDLAKKFEVPPEIMAIRLGVKLPIF